MKRASIPGVLAGALLLEALAAGCSPNTGQGQGSLVDIPQPPPVEAGVPFDSGFPGFHDVDARVFDPGKGGLRPGKLLSATAKIDLLFVVDDSRSMGDKHEILKAGVPDLLQRLANPVCRARSGATQQPADPKAACPDGMTRQFQPVRDIHIGLITSSLGSAQISGASCGIQVGDAGNDGAHLVGTLKRASGTATYAGKGFLAWDPDQKAAPPGEQSLDTLVTSFRTLVSSIDETGCGFEQPLEAWYRFLVAPEPPLFVGRGACSDASVGCVGPVGVDQVVLSQRADFLRPDSLLVIVLLTDENDCSFMDHGDGPYLQSQNLAMPVPSSACAVNPEDPCCHSCGGPAPSGCPATDPACTPGAVLKQDRDPINLRCYDQKRRFGFDALFPVQRYLDGLTLDEVPNRAGDLVPNPLFAGGARAPGDVFVIGITGVPWQDLATAETLASPNDLRLLSSRELIDAGRWEQLLGDPSRVLPPSDALMIESLLPRTGKNPVTGAALAPPTAGLLANPINGHELNATDSLQYSCIFPLPTPRDCGADRTSCDCHGQDGHDDPVCQDASNAYTSLQTYAKAYPSPRVLQLLKGLGDSAVVSSICPKNATDPSREDYGYRPVIGATLADIVPHLIK